MGARHRNSPDYLPIASLGVPEGTVVWHFIAQSYFTNLGRFVFVFQSYDKLKLVKTIVIIPSKNLLWPNIISYLSDDIASVCCTIG